MLPEKYAADMKLLLGEDFSAYESSLEEAPVQGLRVNEAKLTVGRFLELLPAAPEQIPWIRNGFFLPVQENEDAVPSARHPYYYAGLYYLQEPSAMTPAHTLPVEPGDRVLDLCAAPGGKATELGAKLGGRGYLMANDISASRAAVLLKNLERAGIPNFSVTAEDPAVLQERFPMFFDKILVDAPCSGEGMFRKDSAMRKYWPEKQPASYVPVQQTLLEQAYAMLRPGGKMVYSTCTFSEEENEKQILAFLERHPDCGTLPIPAYEGYEEGRCGLRDAIRLYPHRMQGEGHFVVLLQKADAGERKGGSTETGVLPSKMQYRKKGRILAADQLPEGIREFLADCRLPMKQGCFLLDREYLTWLAEPDHFRSGIRYLRDGLLLGTWKKERFQPSQALAMVLKKEQYAHCVDLPVSDDRVIRYLKGETLDAASDDSSWQLVCVDGFPLGWAKAAGNRLKNKYTPAWRWQ